MVRGSLIGLVCPNGTNNDKKFLLAKECLNEIYSKYYEYVYENILYLNFEPDLSADKVLELVSQQKIEGPLAIIISNVKYDCKNKLETETFCFDFMRLRKKFNFSICLIFDLINVPKNIEIDVGIFHMEYGQDAGVEMFFDYMLNAEEIPVSKVFNLSFFKNRSGGFDKFILPCAE